MLGCINGSRGSRGAPIPRAGIAAGPTTPPRRTARDPRRPKAPTLALAVSADVTAALRLEQARSPVAVALVRVGDSKRRPSPRIAYATRRSKRPLAPANPLQKQNWAAAGRNLHATSGRARPRRKDLVPTANFTISPHCEKLFTPAAAGHLESPQSCTHRQGARHVRPSSPLGGVGPRSDTPIRSDDQLIGRATAGRAVL